MAIGGVTIVIFDKNLVRTRFQSRSAHRCEQSELTALGFRNAFVDRTKKNFKAAKQNWSKDIERTVQGLVPNRWSDIEKILSESKTDPSGEPRPLP